MPSFVRCHAHHLNLTLQQPCSAWMSLGVLENHAALLQRMEDIRTQPGWDEDTL